MKATKIIYSSSIEEHGTSKIEIELQDYSVEVLIVLFDKIKTLLLSENYHNNKSITAIMKKKDLLEKELSDIKLRQKNKDILNEELIYIGEEYFSSNKNKITKKLDK